MITLTEYDKRIDDLNKEHQISIGKLHEEIGKVKQELVRNTYIIVKISGHEL